MSPAQMVKDRLLPVLVLTFLTLVLFAVDLVNRLEATPREPLSIKTLIAEQRFMRRSD